ncbi:MAG: ComF family protein [Hyphomicrobiales bacterium]
MLPIYSWRFMARPRRAGQRKACIYIVGKCTMVVRYFVMPGINMGSFFSSGLGTSLSALAANLLAPPKCLMWHEDAGSHGGACPACWQNLTIIEPPLCPRTGVPFPYDPGDDIIGAAALANPPAWKRARAAVQFDEHARILVHALKYRDQHYAGRMMAAMMARAGAELINNARFMVPVPLHRARLWRRRFNQSALLAHRLARDTDAPCRPDILARVKPTRPQVGLRAKDRRRNLRGAFKVPEKAFLEIAGSNILLIDDVLTTGTTAKACADELLSAGAAQVDILVFALVVRPAAMDI